MTIKFESFKGTGGGAVTGGLVYKGSYNATTSSPSLVTAKKGDFYIVSVAGTLAGVTLNVGDHIVFNQDSANPVTSAMFDVIDNTDAVASVNGQTGVVSLSAANVGALAITSNLSDLNNAGTARTNLGLGTAATKDTGTANGNVVLLDATGLPAVDGSQLTGVTSTDVTKLAIANNLSDLNNVGTARTNLGLGTAATKDTGTANGNVVLLDATGLPAVDGSQLTGVTGTDATKLAIANNLSDLNNAGTARTNLGLGTAAVKNHGTSNGDLVLLDATGLPAVDGSQLTGVTSTDVTKLAIASNLSDLNSASTARTNLGLGTAATQTVGTGANNVVQLTGASKLPAVDGSLLTNVVSTDSTKLAIANNLSDLNNATTARTNLGLGTAAVKDHGTSNGDLVLLDATGLPAVDGSQLTNISFDIVNDLSPSLGGSLDVNGQDIVSVSNGAIELAPDGSGKVTIKGNATGGSGQLVLNCENNSHGITLKGPPHSAAASYTLTFPDTEGTADQVLKTDGSGNLDWVDQASGGGGLTYQARTTSSHSPLTPAADYHYSINADSATFVVNLPALSSLTDGQQIRFKLQARGDAAYDVTINRAGSDTIDGATSQTLDVTYSSITLVVGSTEWEIV